MKNIALGVALLSLGLIVGSYLGGASSSESTHGESQTSSMQGSSSDEKKASVYTCSMHPQIKLPTQGKCPLCGMDLIPLDTSSGDDEGERAMRMSSAAMALAEIQTQVVTRGAASVKVEMVGKVFVDPTLISEVILLADGEVRRLYVNYTGIPVKKGEHLAEIYSPIIYAAAEDLLVALNSRNTSVDLTASAEKKLELLGAPMEYIQTVKNEKRVPETYTLNSPKSGYVENLMGYEGRWVKAGSMLCSLVDMSKLWIQLDAYETDLPWIRYGQHVNITAEATPGKIIEGVISYIPPRLDDISRTVKVRVNVDNSDGSLKPGMFVSAVLEAGVTARGGLTSSELKGKWVSPMHPEIVKDQPGDCDICGMALVSADSLGFQYQKEEDKPLLLPETSVLITGKRAVVYVRRDGEKAVFEGREVVLGPKAGSYYVILEGLQEGERVVTKGNFKIDSSLQIQAKPSMMTMKGGDSLLHKDVQKKEVSIQNADLKTSTADFLDYYTQIQVKLSKDEFTGLPDLAKSLKGEFEYFDDASLSPEERKVWQGIVAVVQSSTQHLHHQTDIESFRENFKSVSDAVIAMVKKIGSPLPTLNVMFCSMADAQWLQKEEVLSNPYYGASMLNCGELKLTISSNAKR